MERVVHALDDTQDTDALAWAYFDRALGATSLHRIDDVSVETEVVVRDVNGHIVQRRVTRRGGPAEG